VTEAMLRTVSNGVLTIVITVISTAWFGCVSRSTPTLTGLEPRDELGAAFDQLVGMAIPRIGDQSRPFH